MVSFSTIDILIVLLFFSALLFIGFLAGRKQGKTADDYLLSGRQVGLFVFVLTNVSTWYGGILGVGEFTYRYGLLSWFTQGLPYYFFAFLFAYFFAGKIRKASLFTIPDKIEEKFGRTASLLSAVIVFILVSPAPYLLMAANLIAIFFGIPIIPSLIAALILSFAYLFKGGYRADLYTDVFQFFVMFAGFILIFIIAYITFGGIEFLSNHLPEEHLKITGGASPTFIIIWFFIAMWTFADPGFHQRCYAAKNEQTAKKGILISIIFWAFFDFLTTSTGLYARALIPDISQPVNAFPLLAEKILSPGLKGIFFAALFATILSTLNSFLFLSATTIARDFIFRLRKEKDERRLKPYTIGGLALSGLLSILLAYYIPSVIELWYTLGSICIPAVILPVIGSYYEKFKIAKKLVIIQMITAITVSTGWYVAKKIFLMTGFWLEIEPMIAGLSAAFLIHLLGLTHCRREIFSFLSMKE
jgi:SSS family solute:Na+ symporter